MIPGDNFSQANCFSAFTHFYHARLVQSARKGNAHHGASEESGEVNVYAFCLERWNSEFI